MTQFKLNRIAHDGHGSIVLTNGCFDILHRGHIEYLEAAADLGDKLVVGVNSDKSVRALKGTTRPVNNEHDRARLIAALECVWGVVIFDDLRASELIKRVKPDIWVKGGSYTLETLDRGEVAAALTCGAKIKLLELVVGKSTTNVLSELCRRKLTLRDGKLEG